MNERGSTIFYISSINLRSAPKYFNMFQKTGAYSRISILPYPAQTMGKILQYAAKNRGIFAKYTAIYFKIYGHIYGHKLDKMQFS
ncbi:MAG: hypothetical protein DCF20_09890 [Pseudanabaena sp.]|nr:MAG: hypothetical protein DCF20_09890 [Pseudanabaena sp.]